MTAFATYQFGLIGFPLSHSFSGNYFNEKFKKEQLTGYHYDLFPLKEVTQFPDLLARLPNLKGLNVTIPYKETIIPFLDEINEAADSIGAVNTIRIEKGRTKGYNSDVYGFRKSLEHYLQLHRRPVPEDALILGTGGAAKAVGWSLGQMGISCSYVSRRVASGQITYQDLDQSILANIQLIVNTTPLGMSPQTEGCPAIPFELLDPQHLLFDLVYNPQKTVFLARGERQGCGILNGLEMLHLQAERSWEIWNNSTDSV